MNIKLMKYENNQETILELIQNFWKEHNGYIQTKEESKQDLCAWTQVGHVLYLIYLDMEVIGFAHLGSRGCDIDWLEDLFILPAYQNQGIGSKVLALLEEIVSAYSSCLYMEVATKNVNALRMYHRNGYDVLNTVTIRKDFKKKEGEHKETIFGMAFDV